MLINYEDIFQKSNAKFQNAKKKFDASVFEEANALLDDALKFIGKSYRISGFDDTNSLLCLGKLAEDKKDFAQASHYKLSVLNAKMDTFKHKVDVYKKAKEVENYFYNADVFMKQGNYDKALPLLKDGIRLIDHDYDFEENKNPSKEIEITANEKEATGNFEECAQLLRKVFEYRQIQFFKRYHLESE
jgi:tetratricopeptide (TPR) repeat protein